MKMKYSKFLLCVPSACDLIISSLDFFALNYVPGSAYQMMRGGTIVATFVFSILILNKKI